jgi:hypothetical protein
VKDRKTNAWVFDRDSGDVLFGLIEPSDSMKALLSGLPDGRYRVPTFYTVKDGVVTPDTDDVSGAGVRVEVIEPKPGQAKAMH